MDLTVELISGCHAHVMGKVLTPDHPVETFPLSILEKVRIYSKSTNRLNFGELDVLLDSGTIKMFIPPNFDIRTSAQLRGMDMRGLLTFDTEAGAPIGYRGGVIAGAGIALVDDLEKNAVKIEATASGDVNWQDEGVPVATRDTANFIGPKVTVTDNPGQGRVDVEIQEGGAKRIATFTFLDFAAGFIDIQGPVPAGSTIQNVDLEITGAFSSGARAEVGDNSVHDRLMTEWDSDLTEVAVYQASTTHTYGTSAQLRVYFHGSPTVGSGQVIVYFE